MSPAIHGAAYRELGLPHRYVLVDVPDVTALSAAVARVRSGELAGANVTVPWKREALALADTQAESARRVGAANVLVRNAEGRLEAHNTDVPALAEEIRRRVATVRHLVVIGSGGAALGAVAAGGLLGASEITVSARRWLESEPPEHFAHGVQFRALGASLVPWPRLAAASAFSEACRRADVIVQATSAGMHGAEPGQQVAEIVPWAELNPSLLAYDVVYNPAETEFLKCARERALPHAHGLGMLVGQAVLAIELWLGHKPAFAPLYAAAEAELRARRSP
jgi:shikimate dehydrogenase